MSGPAQFSGRAPACVLRHRRPILCRLIIGAVLLTLPASAQNRATNWQEQVRNYAEMKDWESAMRIVDQQIALAPKDTDVRAWRARVLQWSGNLAQAEEEYLQVLQV